MIIRAFIVISIFFSCSILVGMGPETAAEMRKARAERQLKENQRHLERNAREIDRASLPPMDSALIEQFQQAVEYLAAPERGGRVPGSQGIEDAAVYIETRFAELGLIPAFAESTEDEDGAAGEPNSSFRQPLQMGISTSAAVARMWVDGEELQNGKDFSVLAYSGSGDVEAPVTFTGYAVVSGPGGYMGFENNTSLEGRIALCLNYEPMDENGRSYWRTEKWSHHARLTHKVSALSRRNAGAVVVVSPPNADDDGVDVLETIQSTAPANTQMGAGRAPKYKIPVVMVTAEVARAMVASAGDEDQTLDALIASANTGGIVEPLDGHPVRLQIEMARTPTMTSNIGAILPGRGALKDEYIVVGGHYDHLGHGKFGSRIASNKGKLHPGADDNASGIAGIFLVAEMLKNRYALLGPEDSARSVLFLAFTAEESGLNGSAYYAKHPIVAIEDHTLMLNMDMIGRLESDPLVIGGLEKAPGLEAFVEPYVDASGLVVSHDSGIGEGRSDHASFDAKKVPALFLFTGLHEEYHTPEDTPDLIDTDGGVRVAVLCAEIGYAAATAADRIMHRRMAEKNEKKEPTVRIGILPSNAPDGGMLVERVFPETSASAAGLQKFDRVIGWNGEKVETVESWRPTLIEMSPGDVVILEVERDGEIIEITMTLRAIE